MLAAHLGEMAGLGTACCWTGSYILFTLAVRIAGPKWLNRWRLTVALAMLLATHMLIYGTPLPFDAPWQGWGWLALSGVIGFAVSDAFLFRALLHLGAHRTSVMTSLIPVVSAVMAWIALGETLSLTQGLAAATAVVGAILVISARPRQPETVEPRRIPLGVLFAVGTLVTQSLRYIVSKHAMSSGFPPLSANAAQILAATAAVWVSALAGGKWKNDLQQWRDRRAAWPMIGGAVAGPFVGVTLSLVALAKVEVGIASVLMAMSPVLLLPFARFLFRERVGPRAILGTACAISGVAWLLLL